LLPDFSNTDSKNSNTKSKSNSQTFYLYSVADGQVMQHAVQVSSGNTIVQQNCTTINFYSELNKILNNNNNFKVTENQTETINIINNKNLLIQNGLTEFSALKFKDKENSSKNYLIAIGKFDGSIEIYQSLLDNDKRLIKKLCALLNHQKLVTIIKFNSQILDLEKEDEPVLMASGSNDYNIMLVDLKKLILNQFEANNFQQIDFKLFSHFKHKLVGHKERITGLNWSKLNGKQVLASCSYDSTVQVKYF
jgi:WD40 repeat protein